MSAKNNRQLFYDKKILLLFSGYLGLTLILILGLTGQLLTQVSYSLFTPGLSEALTWSPKTLLAVFLIWSVYGYFFAYIYARRQIRGIVLRMGRLFEQAAEGESRKLVFRKNDPFHAVSKSFDLLVSRAQEARYLKEKLKAIAHKAEPSTRQKLEELMGRL